MRKSYLAAVFAVLWSGVLFGNAGVFRGSGQSVVLDSTEQIQMVEETVVMLPMRGHYPVDSTCRNLDPMKFHCVFKLRNLADKTVTVPVGFPISMEALRFQDETKIDQAEVVAWYGFVAGTKDKTYPVRYVPFDKKKKFSNIFLWDMTFEPKEEIRLVVSYTMQGYLGLASTRMNKDRYWEKRTRTHYLEILEMAVGEGNMYVTETGKSWAGKIEKATFRIVPFDFEKYLAQRGAFEGERAESKRGKDVQIDIFATVPVVRSWSPSYDKWKLVKDKWGRELYLELVYAPFEPKGKEDSLTFWYIFPCIPTTAEQFDRLLAKVKEEVEKEYAVRDERLAMFEKRLNDKTENRNRKLNEKMIAFWKGVGPYSPAVERNLADAVLEFYGIPRNNPEIKEFLELQCWYPVKNPPKIDDGYREFLLKVSRGESGK